MKKFKNGDKVIVTNISNWGKHIIPVDITFNIGDILIMDSVYHTEQYESCSIVGHNRYGYYPLSFFKHYNEEIIHELW